MNEILMEDEELNLLEVKFYASLANSKYVDNVI